MLTLIDLKGSEDITETPDFTGIPNLEILILNGCSSLVEVHPSIAFLKKLRYLDLDYCSSLSRLPEKVHLESLETFILSNCSSLESLPRFSRTMARLCILNLEDCDLIERLPSSIGNLIALEELHLSGCISLTEIPDSICRLKCLKVLKLHGSMGLEKLPQNLGNIEQLEELWIEYTAVWTIPASISCLSKLKILSTWKPKEYCQMPSSLVLPPMSNLSSLVFIKLSNCNICDGGIPDDIGCLPSLIELNLRGNKFTRLPESISELPKLQCLNLAFCERIEMLPELPTSVKKLYVSHHVALESITNLTTNCKELFFVAFTYFPGQDDDRRDKQTSAMLQQSLLRFLSTLQPKGMAKIPKAFDILFPGSEIPDWFSHRSSESRKISVKLPPGWYSEKFLGFAICCTYSLHTDMGTSSTPEFQDYDYIDFNIRVSFSYKDDKEDEKFVEKECAMGTVIDQQEWSILCFSYVPLSYLWDTYETEVKNPNYFAYSIEASKKKEFDYVDGWGIHLLYEDEVEKIVQAERSRYAEKSMEVSEAMFKRRHIEKIQFNISPSSGESSSSSDEPSDSSEDETINDR